MEILTPEEQSIKLQVENQLKNYSGEKATKYVSDKIREQYKYYFENEEVWKDIKDWEGLYQISSFGRVRSLDRKLIGKDGRKLFYKSKILRLFININGYLCTYLHICQDVKGLLIHRLIAQAFIPNPNNLPFINHKNGIKHDNRIENLEWCTQKENVNHAHELGLVKHAKGERHGRAKLTEEDILNVRKDYLKINHNVSNSKDLSIKYGVNVTTIQRIVSNKNWTHV